MPRITCEIPSTISPFSSSFFLERGRLKKNRSVTCRACVTVECSFTLAVLVTSREFLSHTLNMLPFSFIPPVLLSEQFIENGPAKNVLRTYRALHNLENKCLSNK